jgi:uncharacterized membrane protein YdfJ with MMPL/SSD domain
MKNNRSVQCTGSVIETLIIMKTMTEIVLQVHKIYVHDQVTFLVAGGLVSDTKLPRLAAYPPSISMDIASRKG